MQGSASLPVRDARNLADVHRHIAACTLCRDQLDPEKAPRREESVAAQTRIFIVGQALARDTQRITGVPYFYPDGRLGSSGRSLEEFLRIVGATLYPPVAVEVESGTIPPAEPGYSPVYSSDIVQCFPGRKGAGDRFPVAVARRCLEQGYLAREISLVRPALILLLGAKVADRFWRHFAGSPPPFRRLRDGIETVTRDRRPFVVQVEGRPYSVIPLIHPSGQTTGVFRSLVRDNTALRGVIERTLKETQ